MANKKKAAPKKKAAAKKKNNKALSPSGNKKAPLRVRTTDKGERGERIPNTPAQAAGENGQAAIFERDTSND